MQEIADFIGKLNSFDIIVVLALFSAFVLGFYQGSIRRLLGIVAILFSLLLAANLRDPVADFLIRYWTQFPATYTRMLAFGGIFLVLLLVTTILIQGLYKRMPLFASHEAIDEMLGGFLGLVQAVLVIGCGFIVLDSYFALASAVDEDELRLLRDLYNAIDTSQTAAIFRQTLIPTFMTVAGAFMPQDVRQLYIV